MPPIPQLQAFLSSPSFLPFLGFITVWSLFWKGLALWHTAQRKQQWWFIGFLLVNTIGVLEIIYLFVIAKVKFAQLFGNQSAPATPPVVDIK